MKTVIRTVFVLCVTSISFLVLVSSFYNKTTLAFGFSPGGSSSYYNNYGNYGNYGNYNGYENTQNNYNKNTYPKWSQLSIPMSVPISQSGFSDNNRSLYNEYDTRTSSDFVLNKQINNQVSEVFSNSKTVIYLVKAQINEGKACGKETSNLEWSLSSFENQLSLVQNQYQTGDTNAIHNLKNSLQILKQALQEFESIPCENQQFSNSNYYLEQSNQQKIYHNNFSQYNPYGW